MNNYIKRANRLYDVHNYIGRCCKEEEYTHRRCRKSIDRGLLSRGILRINMLLISVLKRLLNKGYMSLKDIVLLVDSEHRYLPLSLIKLPIV